VLHNWELGKFKRSVVAMTAIARIGQGYDVHRLAGSGPLVLAGVVVDSEFGLTGHSDADVVLHAVIDAMLGAAGFDDIGEQYPDTDRQYKGTDSAALLTRTRNMVEHAGYALVNVDTTIIVEQPKLKPYKGKMREKLAQLLGIPTDAVGIKAKTNESLGEIGRGRAIACQAIVSLTSTSGIQSANER